MPDPLVILKAIACYRYQSCEHPDWELSEAAAFCDALESRMIGRLPGYDEAAGWQISDPERLPYITVCARDRSRLQRMAPYGVQFPEGNRPGDINSWLLADLRTSTIYQLGDFAPGSSKLCNNHLAQLAAVIDDGFLECAFHPAYLHCRQSVDRPGSGTMPHRCLHVELHEPFKT